MQLLLVDLHLELVDALADGRQSLAQPTLLTAQGGQFIVLLRPLGLPSCKLDPCLRQRAVDCVEHGWQCGDHRVRRGDLALAEDGEPRLLLGRLSLGDKLARQRCGSRALGANALAHGFELDAQLQFCRPRRLETAKHAITGRGVEHGPRCGGDRVVVCLRTLDLGLGRTDRRGRDGDCLRESLPLRLRRLKLDAKPGQLLALCCPLGVELAEGGEGSRGIRLRHLEGSALLGQGKSRSFDLRRHRREPGRRDVALGNEFQAGPLGTRTTTQHVLGENITLPGDNGEIGGRAQRFPRGTGGCQVIHNDNARKDASNAVRGGHQVASGGDASGERAKRGGNWGERHDDFDPASVTVTCQRKAGERGVVSIG